MTKYIKVLRSPEADPLAEPAGSVDTSIPRLAPDKLYNMEVTAAETKTNDAGTQMVAITLKTVKDESDHEGKPINAGFPVKHNFVCSPTGNLTTDMIKRSGASILKAAQLGSITIRDFINNPSIVVGKIVCVKIGNRKASGGYPEQSEVKSWVEVK